MKRGREFLFLGKGGGITYKANGKEDRGDNKEKTA